jgi:hypothetical protein
MLYGWKSKDGKLVPVLGEKVPVPEECIELISGSAKRLNSYVLWHASVLITGM